MLSNLLENRYAIDLNGIIMLSQILNFDMSVDGPQVNPGVNLPYVLGLPTYAATAWYHKKLPGQRPGDLRKFLGEVQHFAMGDYSAALQAGAALNEKQRSAIAQKLHAYTGLPVAYILKADLRIDGGMFEQNLQGAGDITTGRLDTRFSGPAIDPLNKEADYDPQSRIDQLGLYLRVQRLCADDAEIWRRPQVLPVRAAQRLGPEAPAAGQQFLAADAIERHAGSCSGDEDKPKPQGASDRWPL